MAKTQWKRLGRSTKEPEIINAHILQGIYEELLELTRRTGDLAVLLYKKDIITKDEALAIINKRPEVDDT